MAAPERGITARLTLPMRLLGSYLLVGAVGALTAFLTVRLLAPVLFDQRMGLMNRAGMTGGSTMGPGAGPGGPSGLDGGTGSAGLASQQVRDAFISSLDVALLVGLGASVLAAALLAALSARRLLRPLESVRRATRRIAQGHYDEKVAAPSEPELAALAGDVNVLAASLAETETRRVRLLAEVAHEMRTPLTSMDGYVEGLIDGVFPADPATLGALGEELHRLHRLADDLSALSRTEERRLDLRPGPVDLTELVGRVAARLAPQFDDAGVSLAWQPGEPVPVTADADRIAQVLTNLLGNALAATSGSSPAQVQLRLQADQHTARVSVSDTGVGLTEEDLQRVFERFYRAGPRTSSGSGIGLTIARGIARAHGGDVTADSAGPGRGSTFTLTLPR